MQMNTAVAKQQIAQMKKQLRRLEQEKSNSENATQRKQQEIEKLEEKLWDYEASTPTLPRARLKTWRTITIGQKTLAEYRKSIVAVGNYTFCGLGDELTGKITLSRSEKKVKLAKMNIQELGFRRAYLSVLFDSIRKLGGQPCPPEVPLALLCDPSFNLRDVYFFMKGCILENCGPWKFCIKSGTIDHHGSSHDYHPPIPYKSLSAYTINKNSRDRQEFIFMIPDSVRSY